MELLLPVIIALIGSLLTFFSGFGLGTLMLPVFLIYFPVDQAVLMTGLVHLANNIFKLGLIGKHINWPVAFRFGIPGILAAIGGAYLFTMMSQGDIIEFSLFGSVYETNQLNLVIAGLMFLFAIAELSPSISKYEFPTNMLIPGGMLSGFFGGLSGHQGALRSAFLIRYGMAKEAFIATGTSIACFIDLSRIPIYLNDMDAAVLSDNKLVLGGSVLAAFMGAFIGRKVLNKINLTLIHWLVGLFILAMSFLLALGII